MKIHKMNKETARYIRTTLNKALETAAAELGISAELGGCKFQARTAEYKLEINLINADGEVFNQEAEDFKNYSETFYRVPADALGKTFTNNGGHYKLTGLKQRNRKYPFIGKCLRTGRGYKFQARTIRDRFGKKEDQITPVTIIDHV